MNENELKRRTEEQLIFEEARKITAIKKFRKDLHKQRKEMKGGYTSGTPMGRQLTPHLVSYLTPYVEEMLQNLPRFSHEKKKCGLMLCRLLGTEVVLGICLKAFLDTCGREKDLTATKVVTVAGGRLNIEWCRSRWENLDPDAIRWLEKKYRYAGVWHKMTAASKILRDMTGKSRTELRTELPNHACNYAAAWVLTVIAERTEWFSLVHKNIGGNKNQTFVNLSPVFEGWYQQNHEQIEAELQQLWPMLCPPRDWDTAGENGGYLDPVGKVSKLQKVQKGKGSTVSPKQLDFINDVLQQTQWKINPYIFEVQNHLFGKSDSAVGSFKPICFHPLTNEKMPDHISALAHDHPARVNWRKEASAIHAANSESRRNGIRTVRNMVASRHYINQDKFWVPWSIGHNGRCYILSAGCLSPQGTDAERALLTFAEGQPVTPRAEHHLAIAVGNLYGINETHEAKLKWVEDNKELISEIALNPLDHIPFWECADEPFQFRAACDEYYHCVIARDRLTTSLPIYNDATASGLQILSLLSRDKECAQHVNIIPSSSKSDVYAALKPLLQEELANYPYVDQKGHRIDPEEVDGYVETRVKELAKIYLPRKAYKSNLVSRIYGSVIRSRKQAIVAALMDAHNHQLGLLEAGDGQILATCMERAMLRLAPQALNLFDQIKSVARQVANRGDTTHWTTPVGNTVVVNPTKNPAKQVDLGWFGCLKLADDSAEEYLDKRKVATSTAPLLIHSLDAAILAEAFHDWSGPLCTAHDCVGVRATEVDAALKAMLNAYVTVLKDGKQFLEDFSEGNKVETNWVLTNTLTDEEVDNLRNSQYALC